jgi:hypothetical protein
METDNLDISDARNRVLYDGYKNSLVEWTLSDEWTNVEHQDKPIPRGLVRKCGFLVTTNQAAGEI